MTGIRLRLLPEEERWKKATEALDLSPGQVESLKQSLEDRDRAYEEGTVRRTVETEEGTEHHTEVDVPRLDDADRTFKGRLEGTLNEKQLSGWRSGGYDYGMGALRPKARVRVVPHKKPE